MFISCINFVDLFPQGAGGEAPNKCSTFSGVNKSSHLSVSGVVLAWVGQNVTFLRYGSIMALGDSPCTLLVSLWLGEVVGASLAMGHALVQSLLAPGAIVSVIRCSVGAPSECRVSRVSYLNSRTPTPQASYHTPRKRWTWSPRRGTSPPLDRTSGLPSKAAITDLALPRHHRTRHP